MRIGFRTKDDDYAGLNAQLGGRAEIGRIFPAGMPINPATTTVVQFMTAVQAAAQPVLDAGMIPALSFKFSFKGLSEPNGILNNLADEYLNALYNWTHALPSSPISDASYKAILIWHHEDDRTGIAAADFKNASEYIYGFLKHPDVFVGPVFTGYTWRSGPLSGAMIPLRADFIGFDIYSADWSGNRRSLQDMVEWTNLTENVPVTLPIIIMERGISTGKNMTPPPADTFTGQSTTIYNDYIFLKHQSRTIEAYLYWNSIDGSNGGNDFFLNTSSIAQLKTMVLAENPVPNPYPTHAPSDPVSDVACDLCNAVLFSADAAQLHYQALHGAK